MNIHNMMEYRGSHRSPSVACAPAKAPWPAGARSPFTDGKIALSIHTDASGLQHHRDGKPRWAIPLGLEWPTTSSWAEIRPAERERNRRHTWKTRSAKPRGRDHYNGMCLTLKEGERNICVCPGVHDAWLSVCFPSSPDGFLCRTARRTEFTFADDFQVWAGWNNRGRRPSGGRIHPRRMQYRPTHLRLTQNSNMACPFWCKPRRVCRLTGRPARLVRHVADAQGWRKHTLAPLARRSGAPGRDSATTTRAGGAIRAPIGDQQVRCGQNSHNSPGELYHRPQPADLIQSDWC